MSDTRKVPLAPNEAASNEVWVLGETKSTGELAGTVFELTAKARELADTLSSLTGNTHTVKVFLLLDPTFAQSANPKAAAGYGADAVVLVKGKDILFDRALCGRALAYFARTSVPSIILASATAFGRSVMPYAAALLETGLTADCTGLSIDPESKRLLQTRPAIGGNIMATIETPNHRPQMATVRPRTFRTPEPIPGRSIEVVNLALPEELETPTVETLGFRRFSESEGTLQEKDVVISGGKGLRRAEGFALISRLAEILDSFGLPTGVGATRPVVEMKWIGYPHQVGLSGQVVAPKVYIAAGISGTVQHLAGMQTAEKIVSINRDPDALVFNVSDIAICGDLYEILPRLIEKIEKKIAEKKGASR